MTHQLTSFARVAAIGLIGLACAGPALADPDKDESGHGRGRHREYKEEYWNGHCKVERKWEKDGDYKEERKCEGGERHGHRARPVAVYPQPTVVYPPWVAVEQSGPGYRPGYEPAPVQGTVYHCNSRAVGQVLGGIAGGAIGHHVGKGDGRTVATVGGAVIGVLIGGEIGREIDRSNQACIGQALEFAPAGQRIAWPADDGVQYAVVPGQVVDRNGRTCRGYDAEVVTHAGVQRTHGVACRRSDGAWMPAR